MPRVFDVTTTTSVVQLASNRTGQAIFTVSNASGRAVRGKVWVKPEDESLASWFAMQGEAEFNSAVGSTNQFTVQVTVPPGAAAGNPGFYLHVAPSAEPTEDERSPRVTVEVPAPVVVPKKPFPKWILAVVAAVVVLAIGGAVAFFMTRPAGTSEVPNVVGKTEADARSALKDAKFKDIVVTSDADEDGIAGTVLRTDPPAEATVDPSKPVNLTVQVRTHTGPKKPITMNENQMLDLDSGVVGLAKGADLLFTRVAPPTSSASGISAQAIAGGKLDTGSQMVPESVREKIGSLLQSPAVTQPQVPPPAVAPDAIPRYITAQNGAKMVNVGPAFVGLVDCRTRLAAAATTSIPAANLPAGTYVCVATNDNRAGILHVMSPISLSPAPGPLALEITIWQE